MEGWAKIQNSISGINFGAASSNIGNASARFSKGFSSTLQATKERMGQVNADEITELPQEYKDLEARVDALRNVYNYLLKITRVYEFETYDYPTQIVESVADMSVSVGATLQNFAANNLKGTNLPAPPPATAAPVQHKTLPHALSRAAATAATTLQSAPDGRDDKLAKGLAEYASAWEKISDARISQDTAIQQQFLAPWKTTLATAMDVAMKARAAVRTSRLELDAAKQGLKTASPARQEHARLEVENAEDDLVTKTEVAITLMKNVLDNPEPLKNLNELCKAQLLFHNAAAEALSGVQGDIEELSVAAEADYRKSRDH